MKFRFCGGSDCPDWVLAEVISTLSTLESTKLERLADLIVQNILGASFQEDDIKALISGLVDDGKSAIATIRFLLTNAARHNASEAVFSEEIQQLGLPKDQAEAMGRVLTANMLSLRAKLVEKAFKINELKSMKNLPDTGDTINCGKFELKISQELADDELPQDTTHIVNIEKPNIRALLAELQTAREIIRNCNDNTT